MKTIKRDVNGRFAKKHKDQTEVTYKGTDKDMKCRGYAFELGKENTAIGNIKLCNNGFHSCLYPLDVFSYYAPSNSRYFACNIGGEKQASDNKIASEKITINAEIGIKGIIDAAIKFTYNKVKWSKKSSSTGYCSGASSTGYYSGASSTGDYSGASSTGNYSGASSTGNYSGASSTGNYSGASSTGNCSGASSTGYCSGAYAGKGSVAMSVGGLTRAKGDLGAYIVLTECEQINGEWYIKDVKVGKIDGKKLMSNVWYTLIEGKFVPAKDEYYK